MTYTIQNQQYGASVLDIYMPYWNQRPWPCVFSIHGGGWAHGDEDTGPSIEHAEKLVAQGFMVVSIRYRLAPEHKWPTQLQDVIEAINFILTGQYKDMIGNYGIMGASAGAHIAAMVVNTWYPVPSVLLYGPYDLDMWAIENPVTAEIYLYPCFGALSASESPINRIPPIGWLKPTLLLHGRQDLLVNYAQTTRYATAINAAGGNADSVLVDGDHGLYSSSPQDRIMIQNRILTFFEQNLR